MKFSKGFTLIELLVVVAIMAVLSTLALSSFSDAQKKARDSQRKSDAGQIRSALEMAREDDGKYPYPGSTPSVSGYPSLKPFLAGRVYMKVVPGDPKSGPYPYYTTPTGSGYSLVICLENGNDPQRVLPVQNICSDAAFGSARPASIVYQAP